MKRSHAARLVWLGLVALALLLAACGDDDANGDQASVSRGEELYEENWMSCHGGEDGGEISDSPPPHNTNGHTWHHPDCLLTEITLKGPAAWGGTVTPASMPAFEGILTADGVAAILAYLKTWWTDEQREYQEEVTQVQCD
jgi:mono/diheme cytochrome c family protein